MILVNEKTRLILTQIILVIRSPELDYLLLSLMTMMFLWAIKEYF